MSSYKALRFLFFFPSCAYNAMSYVWVCMQPYRTRENGWICKAEKKINLRRDERLDMCKYWFNKNFKVVLHFNLIFLFGIDIFDTYSIFQRCLQRLRRRTAAGPTDILLCTCMYVCVVTDWSIRNKNLFVAYACIFI